MFESRHSRREQQVRTRFICSQAGWWEQLQGADALPATGKELRQSLPRSAFVGAIPVRLIYHLTFGVEEAVRIVLLAGDGYELKRLLAIFDQRLARDDGKRDGYVLSIAEADYPAEYRFVLRQLREAIVEEARRIMRSGTCYCGIRFCWHIRLTIGRNCRPRKPFAGCMTSVRTWTRSPRRCRSMRNKCMLSA